MRHMQGTHVTEFHGNVYGETASTSSPGYAVPLSNGSQDIVLKDVRRKPVLSDILARKVDFYYLDIDVVCCWFGDLNS